MIPKRVTVFTGNQPRHLALIRALSSIYAEVNVVIETVTVCPGEVQDYYDKSDIMKTYFSNVRRVEKEIFGEIGPVSGSNINTLVIKYNDLNYLSEEQLGFIRESEVFIVFGASFIKGWLADFLVEKNALNVHLGLSPFYRGSSCNFWSMSDGNYQLTGATIHLLSKGLDSGPILFHALPAMDKDAFGFAMLSVAAAIEGLVYHLTNGSLTKLIPVIQDRSKQLRYSKDADFNDEVAASYLQNLPSPASISSAIKSREDCLDYINPFFGKNGFAIQ